MENSHYGKFISFEGGEGSGKSTQVKEIIEFLKQNHIEVIRTREPGGSEGAEALRDLLVNGAANRWSAISETLMMYAARADHVEKLIRPALERGTWVISDRFSDSTRAYQGAAGGVSAELIEAIDVAAVGDTQPDLIFILDIPTDIGLSRAGNRGAGEQRFESKGILFHERLRSAFLSRAKSDLDRYIIIDANQSKDAISKEIIAVLVKRFPILKSPQNG